MRRAVLAALLALAIPARAQERTAVDLLQTALLQEAAYGNHTEAMQIYQRLVRELPLDSAVRAQAVYRLSRSMYELGDVPGAREVLKEGIRTGSCTATPCYTLLGQITLEESSVRKLPVRWSFSSNDHGLLHPWEYDDKGSIRVQSRDEAANPALIWRTIVDVRKDDRLVVGFDRPMPAPARIRFRVQAEDRTAAIRVRVLDGAGQIHGLPDGMIDVLPERPTSVSVDLSRLENLDPEGPRLDPANIAMLTIEDVSALTGTTLGPHALYIDDFAIDE